VLGLEGELTEPPVVTLATQDGAVSYAQPAVADPAGWRADVAVPDEAPSAELGITVEWADGRVDPCALRARGLPSVVAFHPVAPSAPTSVRVTAGDGVASLSWTAGADGNAPLTGYRVVAHPGGSALDVTGTQAVLHGLTNGVAYSFDVTALNAAGTSPATTSAAVVPRRPLVLSSVAPAATTVVYGTASTVTGVVRSASGAALAGVPVELYARRGGTSWWVSVAHATSSSTGAIRLSAVLTRTSALEVVHHPDSGVLPTRAVGIVTVASRVTASARSTAGAAYAQTVTGAVGPTGAVGSVVWLQRYTSGAWHGLATGKLVTSTSYRIPWTPAHAGRYRLRVVRPAATALASGSSPAFTVNAYDTRISVAREILADTGTHLDTTHVSGVSDLADARHNITDTAAGRAARRSSYQNAPGGSVMLDLRTLRLLRRIGVAASVSISEIAGGSHSPHSLHYEGKALDVRVVNGTAVRPGSAYMVVVRACQAAGATQIYYPAHDPYGGHQHHIHCAFA
jgi:hypothetical protein